jgi:NAD(P)-dependent dehydrogenase (short-subunit alcohol dehydrogenase family)
MHVLITGAGRGYGAIAAQKLADAGCQLSLLGRDVERLEQVAAETGGTPVVADVLDAEGIDRAIALVVADQGVPDALVNNAGVGGPLGLAWEVNRRDWWSTIEVNLGGVHIVTTAVLAFMLERQAGRIVNIVSHAGTARWPYGSAYAVSKAAVIKYGENLASEVRKRGIVVLNFHPGILEIGLTSNLFESNPDPGSVEGMVANWFREQIATGKSVDADHSAAQLTRLVLGHLDQFSGRYLTASDDFDDLLARVNDLGDTDYTLGLLNPGPAL